MCLSTHFDPTRAHTDLNMGGLGGVVSLSALSGAADVVQAGDWTTTWTDHAPGMHVDHV